MYITLSRKQEANVNWVLPYCLNYGIIIIINDVIAREAQNAEPGQPGIAVLSLLPD